jgi:hypothetical protein
VVRGRATYEWLEGGRFLIQRAVNDHSDFPDSLCVIGVMEGENDLSMQYFDSRGVHRVYAIGFDGRELTLGRDTPEFAQRSSATLSDDGSTLAGVWQLNEDDQGYRDDLAFTYWHGRGGWCRFWWCPRGLGRRGRCPVRGDPRRASFLIGVGRLGVDGGPVAARSGGVDTGRDGHWRSPFESAVNVPACVEVHLR